jgi:stage II sporulation protein P
MRNIKLNRKLRRLLKKLKAIVVGATIIILTACGLLMSCTFNHREVSAATKNIQPYVMSDSSIVFKTEYQVQQEAKGKILIYHSHTSESYADGYDVVQAGEDLAGKLRKKGFEVEHVTDKFDTDYNKAYFASRKMLETKDLNSYELVIDLHRDAINNRKLNGHDIKDQDIAKLMFVQTTESPNYNKQSDIVNGIMGNFSQFGEFTRDVWRYRRGVNYYNGDLTDKLVLIENGFNTNEKLEVMRANTYLAAAIELYLNS